MADGDIFWGPDRGGHYKLYETKEEALQAYDGFSTSIRPWILRTATPSISVDNIVDQLDCDAVDQCGPDANWSDHFSKKDLHDLQELLDNWCSKFSQEYYELIEDDE